MKCTIAGGQIKQVVCFVKAGNSHAVVYPNATNMKGSAELAVRTIVSVWTCNLR